MANSFSYEHCTCCPRNCGVNRIDGNGYCLSPAGAVAARAALHPWEEPVISGINGSGTVFFTGCNLRCVFCQNYRISQDGFGKAVSDERLADIFLELQEQGAHNINLVTAAPYLPSVLHALELAKHRLNIPVVYNNGGYESVDAVKALSEYVDIWLPDLKYCSSELSARFSGAPDYFEVAVKAIQAMITAAGKPEFYTYSSSSGDTCTLMKKGVIIRHMVLPGHRDDSKRVLQAIHEYFPEGSFLISLMSQYTPFFKAHDYKELNRRVTSFEYNSVVDEAIRLGLEEGFMQEKSSAKEEYTPPFELQGI